MMRVARVQAPAKINAFLRIGPRQPSGFHDLVTLFVQLELADSLVVKAGGSGRSLEATGEQMPRAGLGPVEENLAYRAAIAFAERTGWPEGFSIELTKNIPVGGGLGGGSSDAAAVLKALNALAPKPLSKSQLLGIGASLGSDVPFFVSESPCALAGGRGERLLDVDPLPERQVILALPDFGIATAEAYRWLDEDRSDVPDLDMKSIRLSDLATWEGLAQSPLAGNDFEPSVERRHPELALIRDGLQQIGSTFVRLSGSGSTVFCILPEDTSIVTATGPGLVLLHTRTIARVVQVEVLQ